MLKLKFTDIRYDTDVDEPILDELDTDADESILDQLPTTLIGEFSEPPDESQMADYISNVTGYLVDSFDYKTCPKCGSPLFESDLPGYEYFCDECDENMFEFEAEDEICMTKDLPLGQHIKKVLSFLMKRDLNTHDLATRYALSGFLQSTFGDVCDLADVPDVLSKNIIEADTDTKRAFNDLLEHLCYGEDGALDDTGIRVCNKCGELMFEGYYVDDEFVYKRDYNFDDHFCSRCAQKLRNDFEFLHTKWELVEK